MPHLLHAAASVARAVLQYKAHQKAAPAGQLGQPVVKAQQAEVQVVRSGVQLAQRAQRGGRQRLTGATGMPRRGCSARGCVRQWEEWIQRSRGGLPGACERRSEASRHGSCGRRGATQPRGTR